MRTAIFISVLVVHYCMAAILFASGAESDTIFNQQVITFLERRDLVTIEQDSLFEFSEEEIQKEIQKMTRENPAGQIGMNVFGGILGFFAGGLIGHRIQVGDHPSEGVGGGFLIGSATGVFVGSSLMNYLFMKGNYREAKQRLLEKKIRELKKTQDSLNVPMENINSFQNKIGGP